MKQRNFSWTTQRETSVTRSRMRLKWIYCEKNKNESWNECNLNFTIIVMSCYEVSMCDVSLTQCVMNQCMSLLLSKGTSFQITRTDSLSEFFFVKRRNEIWNCSRVQSIKYKRLTRVHFALTVKLSKLVIGWNLKPLHVWWIVIWVFCDR